MKKITFTEFRKNASTFFSDVEQGQELLIIRHGKPIAEILPAKANGSNPAWKQPALKLAVKGISLSSTILEERSNENIF